MTAPRHLAAVLAAAILALTAGCADEDPRVDDPNPGSSDTATEPTDEPTEPTDEPTSEDPADQVTVPVYFVGQTPIGERLYREFRKVEADNPLEEAAALMTAGDALDPDYGTAYPGGGFDSIEFDGEFFNVIVSDDGWNTGPGMSRRESKLAVQQLVYTLQGVQQETAPVKVFINDSPTPSPLFGFDTTDGLTAAKPLDVLAFMSVTTPEEGATVPDVFIASGVGSSFEATVQWEVRDEAGEAVAEGFTTAEGWIDRLYPWEAEVDVSALNPGTYVFAALTDDPSDGEGAGPTQDTKTIIVE